MERGLATIFQLNSRRNSLHFVESRFEKFKRKFSRNNSMDFFGGFEFGKRKYCFLVDAHNLSPLIRTPERRLHLHGTSDSPSRVFQLQSSLTLSVWFTIERNRFPAFRDTLSLTKNGALVVFFGSAYCQPSGGDGNVEKLSEVKKTGNYLLLNDYDVDWL